MGVETRVDRGFEVPEGWSVEALVEFERKRLEKAMWMALAASHIPRRLGGDASPAELAYDKKISRRIARAMQTALRWWGIVHDEDWAALGERAAGIQEARQKGAQIVWSDWRDERLPWLKQHAKRLATFAVERDEIKWGNKAVGNIDGEHDLIKGAFERTPEPEPLVTFD